MLVHTCTLSGFINSRGVGLVHPQISPVSSIYIYFLQRGVPPAYLTSLSTVVNCLGSAFRLFSISAQTLVSVKQNGHQTINTKDKINQSINQSLFAPRIVFLQISSKLYISYGAGALNKLLGFTGRAPVTLFDIY